MIGVFDSGVGGLTVVREIKKYLPTENILYVGDTARVPWGNKSPETIQRYSAQICDFLVSQKVSKIVIACNTASAVAGDYLRNRFPKVVFFDVVQPAVERVCSENFFRVAVIGTKATIGSGVYQKKIAAKKGNVSVFSKECPLFVPLVEEGWMSGAIPSAIAKKYFQSFAARNVEVMVLGCTHYPFLIPTIRRAVGKNIKIINCATETAKALKKDESSQRQRRKPSKQGKDKYCFTDASPHYHKMIMRIMKEKISIKKISFKA
jgi:glutamate racemase